MSELNQMMSDLVRRQLQAQDNAIRDLILNAGPDFDWESNCISVVTVIPDLDTDNLSIQTTVAIENLEDVKTHNFNVTFYRVTPEAVAQVFSPHEKE